MNDLPKYVFSRTLTRSDWNSTTILGSDVPGVVARQKRENAKDFLFGSADPAATLFRHGLIDECRIGLCSIVLGQGTPLFKPGMRTRPKLLDSRSLSNGVVILRYVPAQP